MHSFLQSDHNCSLRNALTLRSPLGEQLRSIYLHGSTERASKCYFLCLVSTHHCPHTTLSNPPKTLKKEDVRIHVHVYHSTLDGSGVHCKAQSRPSHKTQRPTITYMLHQRRKQRCNDDATTTQRRNDDGTTLLLLLFACAGERPSVRLLVGWLVGWFGGCLVSGVWCLMVVLWWLCG